MASLGVAQAWNLLRQRCEIVRNTAQTTLARLVEKGWLRQRADGNAHYFGVRRDAWVRGIVGQLVDTVFAGSTSRLIATLLDRQRISASEAERIRQLIDRAERGKP